MPLKHHFSLLLWHAAYSKIILMLLCISSLLMLTLDNQWSWGQDSMEVGAELLFFIEEDSFCDSDSLVLLFRHLPGKCTMEKNLKFLKQQYSTVM